MRQVTHRRSCTALLLAAAVGAVVTTGCTRNEAPPAPPAPAAPPASTSSPVQGPEPTGLNKWAILSSPEIAEAELPALLTVALSSTLGIQLVERDQLQAALREIELSALLGEQAADLRLRLGRLVGADGLILLSRWTPSTMGDDGAEQPVIRAILCDARYGARLQMECVAEGAEQAEAGAQQLTALVENVRTRFPHGVQRLVCVPPLVSRSLGYEYDELQTHLAEVLAAAAAAYAGTAQVELEEVHAIRRELELAGATLSERVVPAIVEGEFRGDAGGDARGTFQLRLKVTDAGGERAFDKQTSGLAAAVKYLREELAPQVVRLDPAARGGALSAEQQVALLSAQADAFARSGAFRKSTTLREAALLIRPDDGRLAAALVRDLALRIEIRESMSMRWARIPPADAIAMYRVRKECWRRALDVLTQQVQRRTLSRDEVLDLMDRLLEAAQLMCGRGPELPTYAYLWSGTDTLDVLKQELAECEVAFRQFQASVVPRFEQLEAPSPYAGTREVILRAVTQPARRHGTGSWISLLVANPNFTLSYDRSDYYTQRLARHRDALLGPLAEKHILLDECTTDLVEVALNPDERHKLDADTVADFLQLERSASDIARLHGRLARLLLEAELGPTATAESNARLLSALDAWEGAASGWPQHNARTMYALQRLRARLRQAPNPLATSRPGNATSAGNLRIPPRLALPYGDVPIQVKRSDGTVVPLKPPRDGGAAWVNIGRPPDGLVNADGYDIYWNGRSILCERVPGTWEVIYLKPETAHAGILDVAYDGRNIWAITCCQGATVLDSNGRVLAHVDVGPDLPLANQGAKLAAVAPGRVLAVGSFGDDYRAWCATLALDGDRINVDIFHEATTVLTDLTDEARSNPAATFAPRWIYRVREPGREGGSYLLDREVQARGRIRASREKLILLRLDPERRTAESVTYAGPDVKVDYIAPALAFLEDGTAVSVNEMELALIRHPDAPADRSPAARVVFQPSRTSVDLNNVVIPFDGRLYYSGRKWICLDPTTGNVEILGDGRYGRYGSGVSQFHRVVEWTKGGDYRSVLGVHPDAIPDAPGYHSPERTAELLAEFDRQIAAFPQDPKRWSAKVAYLYQAGRLGEAREVCNAWIRAFPHAFQPRMAWREVQLKIRFGLDPYESNDKAERGPFASFAEWRLLNCPPSNSRSADQMMDAVKLPLVTDEAEWPLAEAGLLEAAQYAYGLKRSSDVIQICDLWERAAQQRGPGADASYLALRAAARLRLGQRTEAQRDAAAIVEHRGAHFWVTDLDGLLLAVQRADSTYEFPEKVHVSVSWR